MHMFALLNKPRVAHNQIDSMFACDHGVMFGFHQGTRALYSIPSCVPVCSSVKHITSHKRMS